MPVGGFHVFTPAGPIRKGGNVIIPDVRFHNEANAIHAQDGIIIKIVRGVSSEIGGIAGHVSEAGVDDLPFNYLIDNEDTLAAFKVLLQDLARRLVQSWD